MNDEFLRSAGSQSLVGLGVLLVLSILHGTAWHIAGCTVFGLSLVALYTASTLYHSLQRPRFKHTFKILDHAAIYLLIAGTLHAIHAGEIWRRVGLDSADVRLEPGSAGNRLQGLLR